MGDNRRGDIEQHGGRAIDPDSLSPAEILERARLSYAQEGRESPRVRRALRMKEHLENPREPARIAAGCSARAPAKAIVGWPPVTSAAILAALDHHRRVI